MNTRNSCIPCCLLQLEAEIHKAVQQSHAVMCKLQTGPAWVYDVMHVSLPQSILVAVLHLASTGMCAVAPQRLAVTSCACGYLTARVWQISTRLLTGGAAQVQRPLIDALASKRASHSQRLRMSLAAAVQRILPDGMLLSISHGGDATISLSGMTMPVSNELAALPAMPLPDALLNSAETSRACESILIAIEEHTAVLLDCAADVMAKLSLIQVMVAW